MGTVVLQGSNLTAPPRVPRLTTMLDNFLPLFLGRGEEQNGENWQHSRNSPDLYGFYHADLKEFVEHYAIRK